MWYGGTVTACRMWRLACLGGRVRVGRDSGIASPIPDNDVGREAADVAVVAAVPLDTGGVVVTPLIGVGGGWMRTADPTPASERPPVRVELGLRAEASVMAAVALDTRWSLVGSVGAGWGAFARASGAASDGMGLPSPPLTYLRAGLGCQYRP
jgi:hypothetical protein